VLSIFETPTFVTEAAKIWVEDERLAFFSWIASDPDVIYFTRLAAGELCMLLVYPKAERDNIPGHILKQIRMELEHGDS